MFRHLLLAFFCVGLVLVASPAEAQPKPPFSSLPKLPFGKKPPAPLEKLKELIEDLGSSNDSDRLDAAEKLREAASLGTGLATDALIKALGDKNPNVRYAAMNALAGIGTEAAKALPAVRERIQGADSQYERVLAIWTAIQITTDHRALADTIPELINALSSDDQAVANRAAQALGALGRVAEPRLAKVLQGDNRRSIVLALDALGSIGARDSVEQIRKLLDSESLAVRGSAVKALGNIGPASKSAVGSIQEVLASNAHPALRARAADALGKIGASSPEIIESLTSAVGDENEAVALAAIRSLVELKADSGVITALVPTLLADERPAVVTEAMVALSEQGESAVPVLKEALKNKDSQYWALLVISDLGPTAKGTVPQLAEMLVDAKPLAKREILMALAKIGPDAADAVPQIAAELDHKDPTVRYAATFAIGKIGEKTDEAEAGLTKNLEADDPFLQMTSAWALAKLNPGNPLVGLRAMRMLAAGMVSDDPAMQQAAAQCLADLKPGPEKIPQLLPTIVQAFTTDDAAVKQSALDAIESLLADADPGQVLSTVLKTPPTRPLGALAVQRFGPKANSAVPALIDALGDTRPEDVAMALAAVGPDASQAVSALAAALGDDDAKVRRAAAFALGKIGPDAKPAAGALAELLASSDEAAKPVAAWALALVAPDDAKTVEAALPQLLRGLESSEAGRREESARAIGQLGPAAASALPALKYAAEDRSPAVRAAAQAATKAIGNE